MYSTGIYFKQYFYWKIRYSNILPFRLWIQINKSKR